MKALILIICTFVITSVQAQQVQWVQKQGGNISDQTNGIVVDGNGDIVVVGTFEGSGSFGSINLVSNGNLDIFIAKYDSTGTCLWAKNAGSTFGDEGLGIALDDNNNIYITGTFGQTNALFDAITLNPLGGLRNSFIAKYNSSGKALWAKSIGGSGSSPFAKKIAVFGNQVFVAGDFYGQIAFDNQFLLTSTPGGNNDAFLAKFTTDGIAAWAKKCGDRKTESVTGLAVNSTGNIFVTGSFDSLTKFNNTIAYAQYLGDAFSHEDLFIFKFNSSGDETWFTTYGGYDLDEGGEIKIDESGYIYATGNFKTEFKIGSQTFNNSGTANTLFLLRLDPNGIFRSLSFSPYPESIGYQKGIGMCIDKKNVFVSGYFGNKYKAGGVTMTGAGDRNPLLLNFDTLGVLNWGRFGNGTSFKASYSLSVASKNNNVYYAGFINGAVDFSGTIITTPSFNTDGFICALNGVNTNTGVSYNKVNELKIYPNPASNILTLNINKEIDLATEVLIYNSIGKEVKRMVPLLKEVSIDVSDLSSGIYYIKYKNLSSKFVIN